MTTSGRLEAILFIMVAFFILGIYFLIEVHHRNSCEESCLPNKSKYTYKTTECYCKVNGKWEIDLDE